MKRLLFDGTATQSLKATTFHGGGEYAKYILRELIGRGIEFDVVLSSQRHTDPEVQSLLEKSLRGNVHVVSSRQEVYALVDSGNYDNFYSALPYDFTDYDCKATLVGVIHGLRTIELPSEKFAYKYAKSAKRRIKDLLIDRIPYLRNKRRKIHIDRFEKLFKIANARYITVSNHSKYSILNFFPWIDAGDVRVYYSPFETEKNMATQPGDYYLMVSGNRPEKNMYRAIKVFDKLFSNGKLQGKKVIVTGAAGLPFLKEVKNPGRFEFLGYVDSDRLAELYRNAYAFVYPSLNEGFGYPPLIAMSCGVPVAASSATSIPEACGDAALYFSPTNLDDMANRILRLDCDEECRARLVERGFRRVAELQKNQREGMQNQIDFILQ